MCDVQLHDDDFNETLFSFVLFIQLLRKHRVKFPLMSNCPSLRRFTHFNANTFSYYRTSFHGNYISTSTEGFALDDGTTWGLRPLHPGTLIPSNHVHWQWALKPPIPQFCCDILIHDQLKGGGVGENNLKRKKKQKKTQPLRQTQAA